MRRRRDDSGIGAVTTALMMPALLFMIMLVVQAGLYWHAHQRASAAADRAAAAAAVTPAGPQAAGRQAAQMFLDGAPLDGAWVQVQPGSEEVQATVGGTAPRLVPGLTFSVEATASAPAERFIPEDERR